jgi:hypothetical protein
MSQLTLNDKNVTAAVVFIPWHGCWFADVTLDNVADFSDGIIFKIGETEYVASLFRAANYSGAYKARIVGGHGGWNQEIEPKSYTNPFGVKLSLIVGDVAKEVGEEVEIEDDQDVGLFFVRKRGIASRVMRGLPWFVDRDGITKIKERDSGNILQPFVFNGGHFADGRLTVSTEFPEEWIPNKRFSSAVLSERIISAVRHTFSLETVRTEVWYQ